ncbi:hypothetical protein AAHC03_09647 [Spirometra sp. Aus1]
MCMCVFALATKPQGLASKAPTFMFVSREDHDSGRNWTEEARLEGHTDWVRDVAWSPSLSLSRQLIASCGQDCRVIIWQSQRGASGQTASEQLGDTAEPAVWKLLPLQTYSDVVWHVSWSLTGNILAVSGGDNKVGADEILPQKTSVLPCI